MSKANSQEDIDRIRREWTEVWDEESRAEYEAWAEEEEWVSLTRLRNEGQAD